ncbi:MAG: hypothetical protein CCU26_14170 [Nitrospira sp. UW-LDO-01]|nr:MAG: hypothetical protein CCU26_14170 [Nitrospira sp. UW-LDO-01]
MLMQSSAYNHSSANEKRDRSPVPPLHGVSLLTARHSRWSIRRGQTQQLTSRRRGIAFAPKGSLVVCGFLRLSHPALTRFSCRTRTVMSATHGSTDTSAERRNNDMNTFPAGMALLFTLLVAWPIATDATEHETPKAPDTFLTMTNPVTSTTDTLQEAKSLYENRCSKCHGTSGNGKGSATKDLEVKPRNYTDKALMETIPDGQLFWIICYGSDPEATEMAGYKKKLSEEQMWSLVHYIRSFAR